MKHSSGHRSTRRYLDHHGLSCCHIFSETCGRDGIPVNLNTIVYLFLSSNTNPRRSQTTHAHREIKRQIGGYKIERQGNNSHDINK